MFFFNDVGAEVGRIFSSPELRGFVSNVFLWSAVPAAFVIIVLMIMIDDYNGQSMMRIGFVMYIGILALTVFSHRVLLSMYETKYSVAETITDIQPPMVIGNADPPSGWGEPVLGNEPVVGRAEPSYSPNYLDE